MVDTSFIIDNDYWSSRHCAANCEVDKQGRINLPANLREYAGIDKEVVSVGVFSRVEIWSKERYQENSDFDDMDEIAEHMADLGIGI